MVLPELLPWWQSRFSLPCRHSIPSKILSSSSEWPSDGHSIHHKGSYSRLLSLPMEMIILIVKEVRSRAIIYATYVNLFDSVNGLNLTDAFNSMCCGYVR